MQKLIKYRYKLAYLVAFLLTIILVYIIIFFVFKITKPNFVKNGDDYVFWYKIISFPGRYVSAALKEEDFYNSGKFTYVGYMSGTDKIFIMKNGIEMGFFAIGEEVENQAKKINDGGEIHVEFRRTLEFYNDTFDDFFRYDVISVK